MNSREPAVAGQFYPGNVAKLRETLDGFFSAAKKTPSSKAIIAPHAGYIYSGRIAALGHARLAKAKTFILLGPNHTGLGPGISVSDSDSWKMPLGSIQTDREIAEKIIKKSSAEFDSMAHLGEHSLEVQLPFLQYRFKEFKIVPVTIASQELKELLELGNAIASLKEDVSVIASSDFSHFIPLKNAKEKDLEALELAGKLKAEEFHALVEEKNLSICGASAITALLQYCRKKGMKKGTLLEYGSSADMTGDTSSVVGYASMAFG
ncbi:MAG: AmmeMemoRadiSam system protein B [Candidatus Diapherotrites archaeon]|nr:AmmeMemoRadiSam system protein B [Candidatus Diapherotrites archaeon]